MQAVKDLDEIISWLARAGRIQGKNLARVQNSLVWIVAELQKMDEMEINRDIKLGELSDENKILRGMLRCAGFTVKCIEEGIGMGSPFWEEEVNMASKTGKFIKDSLDFDMRRVHYRLIRQQIDADMHTLKHFKFLMDFGEGRREAVTPFMASLRKLNDYLGVFFDMIEGGILIDEKSTREWLYNFYLIGLWN